MRAVSLATLFVLSAGIALAKYNLPKITDIWQNIDGEDRTNVWSDPDNWQDEEVPANDGSASILFPGSYSYDEEYLDFFSVALDLTTIDVSGLYFDQQALYSFYTTQEGTALTIRNFIGASSGEWNSEIYFGSGVYFQFMDGVEIDLGSGVELEIYGGVSLDAEDAIFKTGSGTLLLSGNNADNGLNGVLAIEEGFLGLGNDSAAGNALIEIGEDGNPGSNTAGVIAVDGGRNISNDFVIHGLFQTEEDDHERNELNILGDVTFTANTRIHNFGGLLNFFGDLSESDSAVKLTIYADEPVLFSGTSDFTGGIEVEEGAVIFTDINALPTGIDNDPLIPADNGALPSEPSIGKFTSENEDAYIGLLIDSSTDRADATHAFLDLFDPAEYDGIIGFDTDPDVTGINSYGEDIDLSFFGDNRLGSVTVAELTGQITPSGDNYLFGGGGGYLLIGSLLEDPEIFEPVNIVAGANVSTITLPSVRGIDATSDAQDPLTVFINNAENSFSGTVTAEHSAIIFGHAPGTLPTAAQLRPGNGGYIGLQDDTRSISSYLAQFDPTLEQGIIGFDSQDNNTNRGITDDIDLTGFSATSPDFYLGTSTWVNLGGQIILPENAEDYRFAGFKGGSLNVTSDLTDGESDLGVVIGDKDSPATHGYEGPGSEEFDHSSVRLEGTNTYSGGTSLQAGELIVTNDSSLGSGTLTVEGDNGEGGFTELLMYGFHEEEVDIFGPILRPDSEGLDLSNLIDVDSFFEIVVETGLTDLDFTLSGNISGSGGINKTGSGTLNLSGDNSEFDGGIYVSEGTVNILGDTSAGTGPVGFGFGSFQTLNFESMNPTIGGLYEIGYDAYSFSYSSVNIASGAVLTLDVNDMFLEYSGSINGDGGLRISGSGTQLLSGYNSFSGGVEVVDGADLRVNSGGALGSGYPDAPSVYLDGGSLTLEVDFEDEYTSVEGQVYFGEGGGQIRGNGLLSFSDDLEIGEGASISPGLSIGELGFDGPVVFGELGSLTVEIGDGDVDEVISDVMFANTLEIAATSANPFSINVMGEDGDIPTNFDPLQAYNWIVVLTGDTITNFDSSFISLNISNSLESLTPEGLWELQLVSGSEDFGDFSLFDNALMVSFTPVPEPGTFTLLALGLGLIGFRRPRRQAAD